MKKKKRILLVEDDGTLRKLYTDFLQREGFEVEHAVEGKEGLEKAGQGGYDLILLDILLPGLQGQDVLKRLSENPPKVENGPIVMLTNQSQPEVLEQCRALGAEGAIIKSDVSPVQFIELIRGFIEDLNQDTKPQGQ